jgi:hypothetical protein
MSGPGTVVRTAFERFTASGTPPLELFDPEVEWATLVEIYRGHDGVVEWNRTLTEAIGEFELELADQLEELGDCAVGEAAISGTARLTGIEGEVRFWFAANVVDGRIRRLLPFVNRDDALRAAESQRASS